MFDVDSIGLTNVAARFNRGEDVGGQPIGQPTAFHVGVAANPTAVMPDRELSRYRYKVEAGAEFVVMGPIYDVDALRQFLEDTAGQRVPVIAVVRAFETARQAEQLANEEPGVSVPESLVQRMAEAEQRRSRGRGSAWRSPVNWSSPFVRSSLASSSPEREAGWAPPWTSWAR